MAHALTDPETSLNVTGDASDLTGKQLAAIPLLATGSHYTEVARAVGVDKRTVWSWRKKPAFVAALNAEMLSIREAAQARLLSLANKAFDALERTLVETDNDNARIAAVKLVLERLEVTMPGAAADEAEEAQSSTKIVLLDPKKASEELRRRMAEGGK